MSHHHPRPSFPTPSARHTPPPTTPSGGGRPLNPAQKIPPGASGSGIGGRKIRPLIYAIGVAGIVCSGALIGAILKTSREHQQEAPQKTQVEQLPQESPRQQQADAVKPDYAKYIQTLETKRGHLLGQKIQLERKIQDLHESQRRRAEEEAIKKELGMKK
ncbi:hypothetical protein HRR81_003509 [Exophiala dermatitidis]|nr:hypothetical protein HRR81_003509 [Exophiala dermatitidis]KAJ4623749.1 hypothetical protein HRR85_000604 [Exophiala dermatitidis]